MTTTTIIDSKCFKELKNINLTPSSIKILLNYLKILHISKGDLNPPTEVKQMLSHLKIMHKEYISLTQNINEGIQNLHTNKNLKISSKFLNSFKNEYIEKLKVKRKEILKMKIN